MKVYLDNAATTPLDPRVLESMMPYLTHSYGNPGSMHALGIEAKIAITKARQTVGKILGCEQDEIFFTGSGTESDNLAILGYARKNSHKGKHIITTKSEHHAVLYTIEHLEKEGFEVTQLQGDKEGIISEEELRNAIREDTILISIIYANNEIGTIQDIPTFSRIARENKIVFHTDACQAGPYLLLDVNQLGVDMMTLNGSKIYGPKGIGILYKKKNIQLEPIAYGGGQEKNLRSGTENVANIVGFATALSLVSEIKEQEVKRLTLLRDYLTHELLKLPETKLNGHPIKRLPNNVNISFLNIEGESLVLLLNEQGIAVSTGSACSSADLEPSHVIIALGLPLELGHSSIRFSLGQHTTREDISYVLEKLPIIVEHLRKMSPLKDTMESILKSGGHMACGDKNG